MKFIVRLQRCLKAVLYTEMTPILALSYNFTFYFQCIHACLLMDFEILGVLMVNSNLHRCDDQYIAHSKYSVLKYNLAE